MRLGDEARQIVAGGLASAGFLGLFFGAGLVWWLAIAMALAIYLAALLIIGRKRALSEVQLSARVTAADVAGAADLLNDAAKRLTRAADTAPAHDQTVLAEMAEHLTSIRQSIVEDPEDFRAARRFINVYLPKMVQTVETYVKVSTQATDASADRLRGLSTRIHGFVPVVQRIRVACIENDLAALELEVDVLSKSLDRT